MLRWWPDDHQQQVRRQAQRIHFSVFLLPRPYARMHVFPVCFILSVIAKARRVRPDERMVACSVGQDAAYRPEKNVIFFSVSSKKQFLKKFEPHCKFWIYRTGSWTFFEKSSDFFQKKYEFYFEMYFLRGASVFPRALCAHRCPFCWANRKWKGLCNLRKHVFVPAILQKFKDYIED